MHLPAQRYVFFFFLVSAWILGDHGKKTNGVFLCTLLITIIITPI